MPAGQIRIRELQERLREIDARFRAAARQRGFDPDQAENLALPAALAELYGERALIKGELEELLEQDDPKKR